MARNGHFSYITNGQSQSIDLYIEESSQPFGLTGEKVQTRLRTQFYGRGYQLGDASITARATSQDEFQRFSKFVRNHQLTMVNTPGSMAFTQLNPQSKGYQRLMRMSIDAEGIDYRGWIPHFTMTKKGFMDPAPQFTFDFFVVIDGNSTPIDVSNRVQQLWWSQPAVSNKKVVPKKGKSSTTESDPSILEIVDPSLTNAFKP